MFQYYHINFSHVQYLLPPLSIYRIVLNGASNLQSCLGAKELSMWVIIGKSAKYDQTFVSKLNITAKYG